jgi:hypothetical protein
MMGNHVLAVISAIMLFLPCTGQPLSLPVLQ